MILAKRGRPDILTGVSVLSTIVMAPNENDWNKMIRLLSYLKTTINIVLRSEADDVQELKWYVVASFGTHSDLKVIPAQCSLQVTEQFEVTQVNKSSMLGAQQRQN